MSRSGPQRGVSCAEPIDLDRANRNHLHVFAIVYGNGTVRLRGILRDSFNRKKRGRSITVPPRLMNPGAETRRRAEKKCTACKAPAWTHTRAEQQACATGVA